MELVFALLFSAALVCFIIAALGKSVHPRVSMTAAGLAFWVAVHVINAVRAL